MARYSNGTVSSSFEGIEAHNPYHSWTVQEIQEQLKYRPVWVREMVAAWRGKIEKIAESENEAGLLIAYAGQWFHAATRYAKHKHDVDGAYLNFSKFLGWIRDRMLLTLLWRGVKPSRWMDTSEVLNARTANANLDYQDRLKIMEYDAGRGQPTNNQSHNQSVAA